MGLIKIGPIKQNQTEFKVECGSFGDACFILCDRSESCMHSNTISMCFYSSTCMIHIHIY